MRNILSRRLELTRGGIRKRNDEVSRSMELLDQCQTEADAAQEWARQALDRLRSSEGLTEDQLRSRLREHRVSNAGQLCL